MQTVIGSDECVVKEQATEAWGARENCSKKVCCAGNAEKMVAGHLAWAPAKVVFEKEIDRQVAPDVQEPKYGVHCITKV